jgi:serine/threonine protein kinase
MVQSRRRGVIDGRVAEILDDVIVRRARGELLSDEDVLAAHPEQAELLAVGLTRIRGIEATMDQTSVDEYATTITGQDMTEPARDGRQTGDRVAHYVLYQILGEGGFGSVWLAWDRKLQCHVAVKMPRRESIDVERVMREARVVAGMPRHPHVVGVLAADADGDTAYIASEYIDGVTLTDWLASGLPSQYKAAELCQKMADALEHVHAAGVVHRDLKPDNVLMDESGEPRVTDFGLAVQKADALTPEKGLVGTIPYMAPEQILTESVDARTDVYAIGVILFELLTGERPFRGNVNLLLQQIEENDPPSPRSLVDNHQISKDLESICLKCLEKPRERRYQSAGELRDDLRRFLGHAPVVARPVTVFGRLSRWCRRHPSIPLLSGTLFLAMLVMVVVAVFLLGREVDSMQTRLVETAQESLDNSAMTIQRLLDSGFRERFGYVEEAANNNQLKSVLRLANQRSSVLGEADVDVQDWIELQDGNTTRTKTDFFSWFVCNAAGDQVARLDPDSETLGRSFAYRSYFTGRPHDAESSPGIVWAAGKTEPRLSDVFLTMSGKAWVLSISAPVWDDAPQADRLLGVVGVFISIRDVLDNVVETSPRTGRPTRFAYLLYERDKSGQVRIIDHPLHSNPMATDATGRIRDEVAEATIHRDLLSDGEKRDPFELVEWTDPKLGPKLRRVVQDLFVRDWLSAPNKVVIPRSGDYPRLHVVVREARDLVVEPGQDLRRNLWLFGLATLGLAVALLLPVWLLITKRLLA